MVAGHRVKAPHLLARGRVIGRDKPPGVKFSPAVADEHPAVDYPGRAGNGVTPVARRGLHRPDFPAAHGVQCDKPSIQRIDPAPGTGGIHTPVHNQWCGLQPAPAGQVKVPGQFLLRHVFRIDLLQWTEALLSVGTSVVQPVMGLRVGVDETFITHPCGFAVLHFPALVTGEEQQT